MSSFICGPDLFKALAIFAARPGQWSSPNVDPRYLREHVPPIAESRNTVGLANIYADILYRQNVRSVSARYSDLTRAELPGPVDDPGHITIRATELNNPAFKLAPVALLKLCDCLEYQSCETEDYPKTAARAIVDAIRRAIIPELPGYESAPWDYYATTA